jgi:polyisoprenoid-binding protein YceI
MTNQNEIKWISDPKHSEIEFSARHMMISTVRGNFNKFEIVAFGTHTDPESAKVEVTIDTSSINTRDVDRDNHLKSKDFFDVTKFPEMKFVSTSIKKIDDSKHIIKGKMTIKDVTKEIQMDGELEGVIKDPYGKMRAGITVTGEINREDFSLTWNMILEAGKVMVGNKIKITVHSEMIMQD